ncbi:YvrJ family protein [Evansella halocellulosilytica]|uniref:YvrJ family protein n=1 Tax=Evansella halocellulosilytica TaxID=2011013 RepID=UPI000BB67C37
MESWMMMIGEFGFPIVITFYLLYRIERKLDQVVYSINNLSCQKNLSTNHMKTHSIDLANDPLIKEYVTNIRKNT